jgi:hypothetical protein
VTTYQRDDQIKLDHYFTPNYHLLAEYFEEYQNYAQNLESPGTTPISSETDFTNNKLSPALTETDQGLAARPDQVAGTSTNGPKTWKTGSTKQWFNTSAFTCPGGTTPGPCGTAPAAGFGFYGDAQTGIIRGPGQELFDMSLSKEFHFTERDFLEFRAEAFNTFNHTNPGNPNTTLGNASYGQVTSALDPRILELALRLKF